MGSNGYIWFLNPKIAAVLHSIQAADTAVFEKMISIGIAGTPDECFIIHGIVAFWKQGNIYT